MLLPVMVATGDKCTLPVYDSLDYMFWLHSHVGFQSSEGIFEGAKHVKGSAPTWWLLGQQVISCRQCMVHWVAPAAMPTSENNPTAFPLERIC